MIIDTHCHYNCEPLLSEIGAHWQTALEHKVVGGICVGTNLQTSSVALDIAQQFAGMFASVGIHPEEYTELIKNSLTGDSYSEELLEKTLKQHTKEFEIIVTEAIHQKNKKLVAIGEIGLDYYKLKVKGIKRELVEKTQKQLFRMQLGIAFQHTLPIILHVRDQADRTEQNAYYDTYSIVSEYVKQYTTEQKTTPKIILHCASGPIDYIQNFIALGSYIGFAGNITYENASDLQTIFEITPTDRLLLETDAPFLAPNEKKGQVCEPQYITQTAEFLHSKYGLKLDILLANTLTVFPDFQKVVQ